MAAFTGFIDAITGPSFKMDDGTAKVETFSDLGAKLAEEAATTTEKVIGIAKEKIKEPLQTVERVASKAIPASLAACASLQYTGGQGSFANFMQPITLRTKYFRLDGSRAAFIGKPLNESRTLSTLSGFCQCENVKLEINGATLEEQQLIKSYLETGCYIE